MNDHQSVKKGMQKYPGIYWLLGLLFLFASVLLFPRVQSSDTLWYIYVGIGSFFVLVTLFLWYRSFKSQMQWKIKYRLVTVHYVQPLMHGSIYLYWALHWDMVFSQIPLILSQVVFMYLLDGVYSWWKKQTWVLSLGYFPIVFSTNLFLWFRDEHFYWQFVMITLGYFGKKYCTWNREGVKKHIFNPSALSLTLASLFLLLFNGTSLTWGSEINSQFYNESYQVIFVLGVIVQALFSVTLTTLGAGIVLWLVNVLYTWNTGSYWFFDSNIPPAVFLGMHLLVTDPSTSPKGKLGKFIFGMAYGLGVYVAFGVLDSLGKPTFYDKMLVVPFLNLSVKGFERLSDALFVFVKNRLDQSASPVIWRSRFTKLLSHNYTHMFLWAALFGGMWFSSFVGLGGRNTELAFWKERCELRDIRACHYYVKVQKKSCYSGELESCNELGVLVHVLSSEQKMNWVEWDPAYFFEIACEGGNVNGCQNYIVQELVHDTISSWNVSLNDAALLIRPRCEQGNGQTCYLLGLVSQHAKSPTVDRDVAGTYFEKACSLYHVLGCLESGVYYMNYGQTRERFRKARKQFDIACQNNNVKACAYLGFLWLSGQGGLQDVSKGKELLNSSCEAGFVNACELLKSH